MGLYLNIPCPYNYLIKMAINKYKLKLYRKYPLGLVAILIILALVVSGPAKPVTATLDIQNPVIQQGEDMYVEARANILSVDPTDINFIIKIDGPKNLTCFYNAKGQKIKDLLYETQCNHIQIKRDNPNDGLHGYGYGYGYDEGTGNNQLSLHIKMNTNQFPSGEYSFILILLTDGIDKQVVGDFEVTPGSTGKHNYDI